MPRLFHVSETPGIARFEPRPPPSPEAGVTGDVVWAIAESHLPNYLLPRDCPRICFRAGPKTTDADALRFLGGAARVVAFEAAWLHRVQGTTLHLYDMPNAQFEPVLPEAGYWISREAVTPVRVEMRTDLMSALAGAGAEVRLLNDFWPLHDAVAASTLEFSILRKRNAAGRKA